MTVSTTTTKAGYTGNGSTTVFAYPFIITASSQLKVYVNSALKRNLPITITRLAELAVPRVVA